MKTLEDIKQQYARENNFCEWSDILYSIDDPAEIDEHFDNVAKLFAFEVCKKALRNAGESAKTIRTAKDGSWSTISPLIRTSKALHYVDKQSILSEDNIPKGLINTISNNE